MPERDPLRVKDAALHEALYGETVIWLGLAKDAPYYVSGSGGISVPHYSANMDLAWKAEGDLPEAVRANYVQLLCLFTAADDPRVNGELEDPSWRLRRATPQQMCEAMLRALGVGGE